MSPLACTKWYQSMVLDTGTALPALVFKGRNRVKYSREFVNVRGPTTGPALAAGSSVHGSPLHEAP